MTKYTKGKIVKGVVSGIESYGVFVTLDEYYNGLIHISEISHGYVKKITDFINVGDIIYVQILDVDNDLCQTKLSIKNIDYKPRKKNYQKKIIETPFGFKTLAYKLPKWIEQGLNNVKSKKL